MLGHVATDTRSKADLAQVLSRRIGEIVTSAIEKIGETGASRDRGRISLYSVRMHMLENITCVNVQVALDGALRCYLSYNHATAS